MSAEKKPEYELFRIIKEYMEKYPNAHQILSNSQILVKKKQEVTNKHLQKD